MSIVFAPFGHYVFDVFAVRTDETETRLIRGSRWGATLICRGVKLGIAWDEPPK